MIRRTLLALLLPLALASLATPALAAGETTPTAWLRSARPGGGPKLAVAFVTGKDAGGAPEFLSFDGAAFAAQGLFSAADVRNLRLTYLLNRSSPRLRAMGTDASLKQVFALTSADLVVSATPDAPWTVRQLQSGGQLVTVAKAQAPGRTDVAALHSWLRHTLGWDGLVVASSGDRVLALVTRLSAGAKPQALLVKDSAARLHVAPGARPPAAVLELEAVEGTVAVFRVVLTGSGSAASPAGAKLLLEPLGTEG